MIPVADFEMLHAEIRTLRADNERLREERDRFERRVVDYVRALAQSRAENERLSRERDSWVLQAGIAEQRETELRAENERLQGQLLNREASGEWLMAEIERLRAELLTCQETLTVALETG